MSATGNTTSSAAVSGSTMSGLASPTLSSRSPRSSPNLTKMFFNTELSIQSYIYDFADSDSESECECEYETDDESEAIVETSPSKDGTAKPAPNVPLTPLEALLTEYRPLFRAGAGKGSAQGLAVMQYLYSNPVTLKDVELLVPAFNKHPFTVMNQLATNVGLFHSRGRISEAQLEEILVHMITQADPRVDQVFEKMKSSVDRFKHQAAMNAARYSQQNGQNMRASPLSPVRASPLRASPVRASPLHQTPLFRGTPTVTQCVFLSKQMMLTIEKDGLLVRWDSSSAQSHDSQSWPEDSGERDEVWHRDVPVQRPRVNIPQRTTEVVLATPPSGQQLTMFKELEGNTWNKTTYPSDYLLKCKKKHPKVVVSLPPRARSSSDRSQSPRSVANLLRVVDAAASRRGASPPAPGVSTGAQSTLPFRRDSGAYVNHRPTSDGAVSKRVRLAPIQEPG